MKKKSFSYNGMLLLMLLAVSVVMTMLSPYFLTRVNIRNILNQTSTDLILSVGMTFVIISGNIDLSVGSVVGFSGMVISMLINRGVSPLIAVLAGLAVSMLIGLLNGWLVARLKINSFIATLCTMTILRGMILLITKSKTLFGFGSLVAFFGSGKIGSVNLPILLSFLLFLISWILLNRTSYGNYCLFLGANESALTRCGVNAKKYKMLIFMFSALLAGIAGLIVLGKLDSAQPLAGQGYEMDAIAAVILGGTALEGGRGSIIGTMIACLLLNVLSNGLVLLSVSTHYQEIITGVIIILSVLLSERNRKAKNAAASK